MTLHRLALFTGSLVVLSLLVIGNARAGWPPPKDDTGIDYSDPANWPSDTNYENQSDFWSFVPKKIAGQVDARTTRLGTGSHYDRAFAKTIGDRRIKIAITDCGIDWTNTELVNKHYLNAGELPVSACPVTGAGSGHDVNGDGMFNVQDYTTVKGAELPAFSAVCDSRIKNDVNGNGLLDPQDLIAAFSDGKDDDANGYVDDISGWDFFFNDNDPFDEVDYFHGTIEGRYSSAQGNDGRGSIGVCPECSVINLRVGDSFVADSSAFGMATIYAVDLGASVLQTALGTISNAPLSHAAMDYAYANNVIVISGAADENSFHHNQPSTNNHVTVVHSIVWDSGLWQNSKSFFQFENCTNYGAHVSVAIPGGGCSSGATGHGAGLVGLFYSAALQANVPMPFATAGDPDGNRRLTTEEVRQLLFHTVDTFYDPNDATDPTQYPTRDGWIRRFGYGRPNARTAVDAIIDGKIPPEVDLVRPYHFEVLNPDRTGKVSIEGRVGVRGAQQNPAGVTFDYVVEWAPGVDPTDDKFQTIGGAEMQTEAVNGPLAEWDLSSITIKNPVPNVTDPSYQPDDPSNVFLATLRVRATMHSSDPRTNGLVGESRRGVHVLRDPDLFAGFPVHLGASGESSPKFADLDGNGTDELIVGDAAGYVHAFTSKGGELAGFPVHTELLPFFDPNPRKGASHAAAEAFSTGGLSTERYAAVVSTVAIGDVDGDGKPEIVAADWHGGVYAWKADGSIVAGFPVHLDGEATKLAKDKNHRMDDGVFCSVALADLDKDGKLDLVVAGMDAKLYAWTGAGQPVRGFPVLAQDPYLSDDPKAAVPRQRMRIMGSPAIGDLNKDGIPDVVFGTNENYNSSSRLYAVDGRGTLAPGGPYLPGWPVQVVSTNILPVVGEGVTNAPAIADIDKDGSLDVIACGVANTPNVFNASGKPIGASLVNRRAKYGEKSNSKNEITLALIANPSVADLDGDGTLDILQGAAGGDAALAFATGGKRRDFEHHVAVWNTKTGEFLPGFPRNVEDWQFFLNPIAADIDDDGKEEVITGTAGYFVHAFNADGEEGKGFPKFTGGWIASSPALGDFDGDGKLDMAVGTRDGWMFAWHTLGTTTSKVGWASFHHDNRNTGNYEEPLSIGVRDAGSSGCTMGSRTSSGALFAFALFALLAVGLRRRARRS